MACFCKMNDFRRTSVCVEKYKQKQKKILFIFLMQIDEHVKLCILRKREYKINSQLNNIPCIIVSLLTFIYIAVHVIWEALYLKNFFFKYCRTNKVFKKIFISTITNNGIIVKHFSVLTICRCASFIRLKIKISTLWDMSFHFVQWLNFWDQLPQLHTYTFLST